MEEEEEEEEEIMMIPYLVAWKFPSLPRFSALGHFNLEFVCVGQIRAGNPKPS